MRAPMRHACCVVEVLPLACCRGISQVTHIHTFGLLWGLLVPGVTHTHNSRLLSATGLLAGLLVCTRVSIRVVVW